MAARRCWSACPGSRTASCYNAMALLARRADRGGALQGRPAELRRVRREAGVRARAGAGTDRRFAACASAFRSARTSGGPIRSNASSRRAAKSCSSPTPRPTSATSCDPPQCRGRARRRERPAADLSQQVGGQDELVFEGASFALNADPALAVQFRRSSHGRAHRLAARAKGWRCVEGPKEVVEEGDEGDMARA